MRSQTGEQRRIAHGVDLRRRDDLPFCAEVVAEQRELALDRIEIVNWISPRLPGHINEVDEHLRPIEMLQESIAEAVTLVSAFNQARHVGDDEAAIAAQRYDAEIG